MSTTSTLTLRLQGLSDVDESAIRVFLAFIHEHTGTRWELTTRADADLLLQGLGHNETLPGTVGPRVTVWVAEVGQRVRDMTMPVLTHPLKMEEFETTLRVVAEGLAHMPPRSAQADETDRPRTDFAATQVLSRAERDMAVLNMLAPRSAEAEPAPLPKPIFDTRGSYRLKQWPSAEFMTTGRYHPRLASFLSHRHISLNELIVLSNVELAECIEFLNGAQALGLLDVRSANTKTVQKPTTPKRRRRPGSVQPKPIAAAGVTTTVAVPEADRPGLLARLRGRFGFGG